MLFLCKIVTRRTTEASITSEKNITQFHNKETDSQTNNEPSAPANTTDRTKTGKKRKTDGSEVDRQILTLIKSVEDEDKSYTTATPDYRINEYQPTQPIPSTSRMPYEYQPTQHIPSTSRIPYENQVKPQELMQQDDSQSSIVTELSSITTPDSDFDFSISP
ncbi:unnamed protein product [Diatraea saccharalis]|uniref:Uncharacterized protein n=1 Tax=Diatraea saccharalis TaxID=40085 RepID=A0A9N9RCW2_9NEOP|nr:unnamed protein product [Diatraea saccharalis]